LVKLFAGGGQWTGVVVDSRGLIITTSGNLGDAPVASFTTFKGTTGEAWVIGRDDVLDLALLEVINPGGAFDTIILHEGNPPQRDEDLALLQFPAAGSVLAKVNTRVVGSRQDVTGVDYLQLQAFALLGAEGGAIVDASGRLRALRMDEQHMINIGIARLNETWAVDAGALSRALIPRLQGGISVINTDNSCPFGPPPGFVVYKGDMSVGGVPVPVGSRVFGRISNGDEEKWFSNLVTVEGRYLVSTNICDKTLDGGVIDFWFATARAPQTGFLEQNRIVDLTLTFQ
jgi:hypothetical protein